MGLVPERLDLVPCRPGGERTWLSPWTGDTQVVGILHYLIETPKGCSEKYLLPPSLQVPEGLGEGRGVPGLRVWGREEGGRDPAPIV